MSSSATRRSPLLVISVLSALSGVLLLPLCASAEVVGLDVVRESFAGGAQFGLAGSYEKLRGRVQFALDPEEEGNRGIVDLELAPRGEDGRVHFESDLYVLQPAAPEKRRGTLFFEVPNRGGKAIFRYFQRGAGGGLDPKTLEDAGDAFLLSRGFTLVWLGWQWDVPERDGLLRLHTVFVDDPSVEGMVRADHVFPSTERALDLGNRNHIAYPVADSLDPRNQLTVRSSRLAQRRVIPRDSWQFARADASGKPVSDPRSIFLEDVEGFVPGLIYEAVYAARNPAISGLGFAAMRDFAAYCKHDPSSPVRGERALAMGISQTGRFLRTFLYQGFNRDLEGRSAFDGMLIHTAGAGRGSFNHRFAQASRDAHPFSAFFYPTDIFPFSDRAQTDAETDTTDGLLDNPRVDRETLPRIFMTNTGYEYWGRAAGLIHSAVDGRSDVAPGNSVRLYHFAGTQHFVDAFPPRPAGTRYPGNPADFLPLLRSLLLQLEGWVESGHEPPPSRIPRLADGTLTLISDYRFPDVPAVEVPVRAHEAYRMDYGPRFRTQGIVDEQPPRVGRAFPQLVPQVDADGNELGGVRLPEVAVPLATYTSWNWRSDEIGAPGELADFRGAFLPLPRDVAERESAGDPRRSIAERYADREQYLGRYAETALELIDDGFLLEEDLAYVLERARQLWSELASSP